MPRISFNTQIKPECIVYLDSIKKTDSNVYNIFVDFRTIEDLQIFTSYFPNLRLDEFYGTYLKLISVKSYKRLRKGCYYKLNLTALSMFMKFNFINDSYIFYASIDLSKMNYPNEENEILQHHSPLDNYKNFKYYHHNYIESLLPSLTNEDLSIIVRNVGQAN